MLNVFVSGIDRKCGKTLVVSGLGATMQSLSYSTTVYKPIQMGAKSLNGFKSSPDLTQVKLFDSNINTLSSFMMNSSAPPFVGAYEDKVNINVNTIYGEYRTLTNSSDCILIEGSNSISTPVCENITEADVVRGLGVPLLLVVNPKITPIDNVIAGITYIKASKVNLLGVIINQYNDKSEVLEHKYFPQILKEFTGVNILGVLPDYGEITTLAPETLIGDVINRFNLEEIFRVRISKLYD